MIASAFSATRQTVTTKKQRRVKIPFVVYLSMYLFFLPLSNHAQPSANNKEKMIIVSHVLFTPYLSRFIEAKKEDNIECRLITVDSTDDFSSIKNKIVALYTEFNADFLLLVGDFEHIPAYRVDEGLSDIHYTFENENNPIPRMIAGRFSVKTEQDVQTMIDRSINRLHNPSRHVVGIASETKSEHTQKQDYEQIRLMGKSLQSKGFAVVSELFDGSQGGEDKDGNPTCTDVINLLHAGVTWINYAGYGSYDGWKTSGFESRYIDSLTNSNELPIIVSASCLGGHFANRECFAEKWLRSTQNGNPTGAVAVIMSSSLTDWDATLSAMSLISETMPAVDSNYRLGYLYRKGYLHIVSEMQRPKDAYCWILFGDPSLWVYPPVPVAIPVDKIGMRSSSFVYPNPASSTVWITLAGVATLYDIQGKAVYSGYLPNEKNQLDISWFNSGLYMLVVTTNGKTRVEKLHIKK
jgi:hypothetical protein